MIEPDNQALSKKVTGKYKPSTPCGGQGDQGKHECNADQFRCRRRFDVVPGSTWMFGLIQWLYSDPVRDLKQYNECPSLVSLLILVTFCWGTPQKRRILGYETEWGQDFFVTVRAPKIDIRCPKVRSDFLSCVEDHYIAAQRGRWFAGVIRITTPNGRVWSQCKVKDHYGGRGGNDWLETSSEMV